MPTRDLADRLSDVLAAAQAGVVSWAQLGQAGGRAHDLDRLLRRRELVRLLPRVYLDHTGTPTWMQRGWAAVLWAEPAALSHGSAVRIGAPTGQRRDQEHVEPIEIVIDARRRLVAVPGVVVHRSRAYADRVLELAPPRVRLEDALLDVAARARTDLDAAGVLADACGARRTTPARLRAQAALRPRLAHRARLVAVLGDAAHGTCSALEQTYVDLVARPHGLPLGERQASHRHQGDQRYRDVLLAPWGLCIELDGRLHHGSARARDADLERDLDAIAAESLLTVRLSWGQSADRSCATAARLDRVLLDRGWAGPLLTCRSCGPEAMVECHPHPVRTGLHNPAGAG